MFLKRSVLDYNKKYKNDGIKDSLYLYTVTPDFFHIYNYVKSLAEIVANNSLHLFIVTSV